MCGYGTPRSSRWNESSCEVSNLEAYRYAIEVPFESGTLPGYFLEIDGEPRPTVLVVGGGDTFREDLYYYPGSGEARTTC